VNPSAARPGHWPVALALALAALLGAGASAQSTPTFRGGGALFTIQVQVVAAHGGWLPDLLARHFTVVIGGRERAVRFAELVKVDDGWARASLDAARVRPIDSWDEDSFFKPVAKRASALYVLGIEIVQPERELAVRVDVSGRGLTARRWMWRTLADQTARFALKP